MRKTPEEFALWLAGAVDTSPGATPTPEQWARIREQLAEVVGGIMKERMLREKEQQDMNALLAGLRHPAPTPTYYQPTWVSIPASGKSEHYL